MQIFITDHSDIGESRRRAVKLAQDLSFDETECGKIALIATELASNLLKHARKGELILQKISNSQGNAGLDILGLDKGPGISNIAKAMRDGFSSSGTSGTGLGAISRLSSQFDLHSDQALGTAVWSRSYRNGITPVSEPMEEGSICVAMAGETVSGDAVKTTSGISRKLVLVVDGLGHGPLAAEASNCAIDAFHDHQQRSPAEILNSIHSALRPTRGAAAAVAEISLPEKRIRFAGVGNIGATLHSSVRTRNLVSFNGTLGHNVQKISEFEYPLDPGALLIVYSDGLSGHWDLSKYQGLTMRRSTLIAGLLYRDFSRRRDDATVVVVKTPAPDFQG